MADLSIQFHALPHELGGWVKEVLAEIDLHVLCVEFPPFQVRNIPKAEVPSLIAQGGCSELVFLEKEPNLPAATGQDLAEKNPRALYLEVGQLSEKGLGESWLTCRTRSLEIPKPWKTIAAHLKKITEAGATAINPQSGATSRMKNHRFTKGAKTLFLDGTPILPFAGTSIIRLGIDG